MRKLFLFVLVFNLLSSFYVKAEEIEETSIDLNSFINKNKKSLVQNVIYDGTNLLLCSDGSNLLVQLQTKHPAIQMRLLMQGMSVFIDPTGKKKEKYAVIIPSANDVKEQMESMHPLQRTDGDTDNNRPDIRPLIRCLSDYGSVFDVNGKSTIIQKSNFSIHIDEESGLLVYSVLLSIEQMLKEKKLSDQWRLGIYSQGGHPGMGEEGHDSPTNIRGFDNGSQELPHEQKDHKDKGIRSLLKGDIEEWVTFSFSEICSIND